MLLMTLEWPGLSEQEVFGDDLRSGVWGGDDVRLGALLLPGEVDGLGPTVVQVVAVRDELEGFLLE